MKAYYQETDSKDVFALPNELSYPFSIRPENETLGGNFNVHYVPLPKESDLLKNAWRILRQIDNQEIAGEVRKLLATIQGIISTFQQSKFDLSYLPPLHAFLVDDGSVLVEWISSDFRIGFSIEPNPSGSGWYLVSNRKMGGISASGYISDIDIKNLIIWLLSFILLSS